MHQEYYSKLGLPEGASKEEVKKRYRQLVKSIHPDVNKSPDANKQFIELTEAYEILIGEKISAYQELENAFNPKMDREERYRRAMEDSVKRKLEMQALAKQAMKKGVLIYNYIVPAFFLFSLLSMIDVQLENRIVNDKLLGSDIITEYNTSPVVILENHGRLYLTNQVSKELIYSIFEVHKTPIFNRISGIGRMDNEGNYKFCSIKNDVTFIIRFLSFASFILTCLFFYSKSVPVKFNLFTYLFFSEILMLAFIFYHGSS